MKEMSQQEREAHEFLKNQLKLGVITQFQRSQGQQITSNTNEHANKKDENQSQIPRDIQGHNQHFPSSSKDQKPQIEELQSQMRRKAQEKTSTIKKNMIGNLSSHKGHVIQNKSTERQGRKNSVPYHNEDQSKSQLSQENRKINTNRKPSRYDFSHSFNEDLVEESQNSESMHQITRHIYSRNQYNLDGSTLNNPDSMKNILPLQEPNSKDILVTSIQVSKREADTQTDLYELFQFFIKFLKKIEKVIKSGKINQVLLEYGIINKAHVQSMEIDLEDNMKRLELLQRYLQKIAQLKNKNGDVFFRSIFKIFQAHPHLFSEEQVQSYHKQQEKPQSPNFMVKIKYSVGGGFIKNL